MTVKTQNLHQVVGIKLPYQKEKKGGVTIKIERFILDLYALRTYKTFYAESKEKVNKDIRQISIKLNTTVTREIKLILISGLVSENIRESVLQQYGK